MKVQAATIEELFIAAGEREPILRQLDEFIQKHTGDIDRSLLSGMSMTMIAYGMFHYTYASGKQGDWPVIALAAQKNYISIYVCATVGDEYIAEKHKDSLGKVSVGKSCIRFKKIEDLNLDALGSVINMAVVWFNDQPKPTT